MRLWQVIVSAREELLEVFVRKLGEARAPGAVPVVEPPPQITGLLDQLTVSLRALDVGRNATLLPEGRGLAGDIGEASAEGGRTISELVSDFLALHEAILEVVGDAVPGISFGEHQVLTRGISRAIAAAVDRYAEARDRELERAHSEHFAFLAHELRSPLSNIKMGIDLLGQGLDAQTLLPRVRVSADRMRELLDNEISSARLRAGSALHGEQLDLVPLLEAIVEALRMQATDRAITLTLEAPEALLLWGDPRLLRSIFTNLIGNAVKFTARGGSIVVRGRSDAQRIVCEVADGCGGIAEESVDRLFHPYAQVGRDRSGFGLGLSIVAEAVRRHDGEVAVENRPGHGCTMSVSLPRARG